MNADATKRTAGESVDGVRLESERRVYRNPSGSPPGTPGREGQGRDPSTKTAGRARDYGGAERHRAAVTARLDSEQRSAQRFAGMTARAHKLFPPAEFPQANPSPRRGWYPMIGLAITRLKRAGKAQTHENVIEWLLAEGWPAEELRS